MSASGLLGASRPPASLHDVALLDLDGVVYIGDHAVPGAVPALTRAVATGMRLAYVTNNASRTPDVVAEHLRELGLPATGAQVVTSAQAGARLLAERIPPGAEVLAVGGEGVHAALRETGLEPVRRHSAKTRGVLQGFGRTVAWPDLADAAIAVRSGLPWIATNPDVTVPVPGGIAPGNGALVAAVAAAAGRDPDDIAGKPFPALMQESIRRSAAARPIVVGDRLDTDIEGARAAGVPSLLVLTGVTTPSLLLRAGPASRPDLVAWDLAGLLEPHDPVLPAGPQAWTTGGVTARVVAGTVVVDPSLDPGLRPTPEQSGTLGSASARAMATLRCACAAAWSDPGAQTAGIGAILDRVLDGAVGDQPAVGMPGSVGSAPGRSGPAS